MTRTVRETSKDTKPSVVPRGRPKSGRVWKNPKQRSSTVVDVKPWRKSWHQHQKERYDKRKVMELEKELKEKAKQEKEEKKKRIEENRRRKEENRKKSEVVQKITNTAKLRRLRKRKMKGIEIR